MTRSERLTPAQVTKRLRDERAAAGLCIYDRRDTGGPAHGPPVKAKRCQECYEGVRTSKKRRKQPGWIDGRTRAARRGRA
jgi:hypothetical protein